MSVVTKIFNILYIIKIYYWFTFVASIQNIFKSPFSQLSHRCMRDWCEKTIRYLKIQFVKLEGSKQMTEERVMVLPNHKSQADFSVHNHIVNHICNFIARAAVGIVIPAFLIAWKTLWFFNRNKKSDPEEFNQWLDKKFQKSNRKSLLAYIEGHRMTGSTGVIKQNLKTGMIRYAYRRKMKCQLLMTFGNQNSFNEKALHVGFGHKIYYKFAEIIDPKDFATQQEFVITIKNRFCEFFDETYQQYQKIEAESSKKSA